MKKPLCFVIIVLITFTGLFAQGGSETTKTAKPVTLTVWDSNVGIEGVVNKFNDKMKSEGRNVKAIFEQIPYEQQVPKFIASLNAKTAPDIYSLDVVQFPYFISIGAFTDITDVYQSMPYKDSLPKGMLPVGSKDGKIYALPYELDLSSIIYNKDLFREAGLDPENPPQTWDEFTIACRALTKDLNGDGITDQWAFAEVGNSGGAYMFWFMPWIWGNNGRMFDDSGNLVLNSPEVKETLQYWYDLIYKEKVAIETSLNWGSGDRYNAFVAKKIAMYLGGNFNISSLQTDAPDMDFGVCLIPRNKGENTSFAGGNMMGITSQCPNVPEAKEFLKFAYDEDVLVETYAPNLALIPRADLYDNKYYEEIPQMAIFADILAASRTPVSLKYNLIYDPVLYYFQGALLDKIQVDKAVVDCTTEINRLIK